MANENLYEQNNPYATGLWSQNGAYPVPLPLYVRSADGQLFSAESAVENAGLGGWSAVSDPPPHDDLTQVLDWDGDAWVVRLKTVEELAGVQEDFLYRINKEAGDLRSKYITVIPGQEGTYLEKAKEATRYFETDPGSIVPTDYPYLSMEAAELGITVAELAAQVRATEQAWTLINASIEAKRRGAQQKVYNAIAVADGDALRAVFPIDWPSGG